MKKCSTSYVVRELQIKTMKYHYIPIRMAKIEKTDHTKYWYVDKLKLSYAAGCNVKKYNHLGKQFYSFL